MPARQKLSVVKKQTALKTKTPSKGALNNVLKLTRPSLVAQMASSVVPMGAPKIPPRVQSLIDKSDIAEVIYTLCRGLDRIDETLLRAVFHPDATVDLGPGLFQGTSNDYVPWEMGVLQQIRSTHHFIGNMRAEIEGDTALVESYFQIHHRLDKSTGREDVFMGGRFLNRLDRRPSAVGVWKIVHHKKVLDWTRTEAVSELFYHQNPDALWSYRTKTDPSYQMTSFPGGGNNTNKSTAYMGRRYESKSIKF